MFGLLDLDTILIIIVKRFHFAIPTNPSSHRIIIIIYYLEMIKFCFRLFESILPLMTSVCIK